MAQPKFLKLGLLHINLAWVVRFEEHPSKDQIDIEIAIQNQKQSLNHTPTSNTVRVVGESARRLKHWLHTKLEIVDIDSLPETFDTMRTLPRLPSSAS